MQLNQIIQNKLIILLFCTGILIVSHVFYIQVSPQENTVITDDLSQFVISLLKTHNLDG